MKPLNLLSVIAGLSFYVAIVIIAFALTGGLVFLPGRCE